MVRITDLEPVSVALLVARRTNNRKVVGSMPANVVCVTVDR